MKRHELTAFQKAYTPHYGHTVPSHFVAADLVPGWASGAWMERVDAGWIAYELFDADKGDHLGCMIMAIKGGVFEFHQGKTCDEARP